MTKTRATVRIGEAKQLIEVAIRNLEGEEKLTMDEAHALCCVLHDAIDSYAFTKHLLTEEEIEQRVKEELA